MYKESRFKISFIEAAYIILCSIPIIISYLQVFAGMSYGSSLVIAVLVFSIFLLFLFGKNKLTISVIEIKPVDIVAILFTLFITSLQIFRGDSCSWDTLNYHIYSQKMLTRDIVKYDFFPGRAINSMYWVLGDQINYVFRYLLGYRLGTIANSISFYVCYQEIKKILNGIMKDENIFVNDSEVGILSIIVLLTESILWNINTYYIDILYLPLLLMLFYKVIFCDEVVLGDIGYLTYIAGLCVSMKASNAFFIIVLAVAFIVRFKRNITLKYIFFGIMCAVAPIFVYAYRSFIVTGNPLFPYANTIFKSDYFTCVESVNDIASFDIRFGPETIFQYIFFPFYCMWAKERIVDNAIYSGRLLFVYVSIFIAIIFVIRKKMKRLYLRTICIWCLCYCEYLFFLQGYIRYATIIEVIGTILAMVLIYKILQADQNNLSQLLGRILKIVYISSSIICLYCYICNANGHNGYETIIKNFNANIENAAFVWEDRKNGISDEVLNKVDVWLVTNYDSAYSVLLKDNVPIINIKEDYTRTNEYIREFYKKRINDVVKNRGVYAISNAHSVDEVLDSLNKEGFVVDEITNISPNFMDAALGMYLFRVLQNDYMHNRSVYSESNEMVIKLSEEELTGKLYIGIDAGKRRNVQTENYTVMVCGMEGKADYILVDGQCSYGDEYKEIPYKIDKSAWNENTSISIFFDRNIGTRIFLQN